MDLTIEDVIETNRDLRWGRRSATSLRRVRHAALSLLLAPLLATCAPSIAPFSAAAYEQATSLKVDALSLMSKATEPYAKHRDEVATLNLKVAKAYEFSRGRPKNEISAQQWAILADSSGHLLGGFLARWKRESSLSTAFVTEMKHLVSDAFDTIIGLESGKIKPDQVK